MARLSPTRHVWGSQITSQWLFMSELKVTIQPHSDQCWPAVFLFCGSYNRMLIKDTTTGSGNWDRSPSVVINNITWGKDIWIHIQVQITEWWLLINYSILYKKKWYALLISPFTEDKMGYSFIVESFSAQLEQMSTMAMSLTSWYS